MYIDFKKIREYRKQKKIAVKGFCELCGIGRTTFWDWEHGKSHPNETKIRTMAKILGVTVGDISDLPAEYDLSDLLYNKSIKETASSWFDLHYNDVSYNEINIIKQKLVSVEKKLINASSIIRAIMTSLHSIFYIKDVKGNYIIANKVNFIPGSRRKKWGLISKYPIKSNKGRPIGLIAIISDITKKHLIDQKRILLENTLDHVSDVCIASGKFSPF